ncbi:hypothetical protein BD413DRAFT_534202 [Trametes elegans]|nr:hypothetical protein BD413DRAFT_534202 [Trametes elegans]
MADSNTIHSLTSTLSSQPMSTPGGSEQHVQHPQHPPHLAAPGELQNHPGMPMGMGPPPPPAQPQQLDGANPEQPVKRRPGRPKGSGKKPVDPNAPPKIKRPVGRPRKDGLPAGSVGPRRPSRPRKRPPGTYASGPQSSPPASYGYGGQFIADPAWGSASAPPLGIRGGRPPVFPIDPSLEQDDWADMARNRPDRFLHALVAALEAPNPVSGAGPSVEEAFKSHLVSLAPNSKNAPSIPSLYSILKTFWLPSSPVYFSLTASASTARTPSEHRFLYWDPQPLVFNGICCPACAAPLTNRGRISSGPIKVYDLGKPFFVIGCEYVCTSPVCLGATAQQGRKFASTDASILRALPLKLKDEFPALLLQGNPDLGSGPEIWSWHGMGVSTTLWNMVRASLRAGLRKEAILDIIRATQLGVSDYDYTAFKREEEEHVPSSMGAPGADDEDDQESHDVQQVEGDLADPKDKSAEEYQEAWNANSGVPEANGVNGAPHLSPEQHHQQPQSGPSSASPHDHSGSSQQSQGHPSQSQHSPNQSQAQNQSASAGQPPPGQVPPPYYAYPQGPYQPYPYPAYWHQPPPPPLHASTPAPGHEPGPGGSLKRTFSIVDGTPEPGMSEPLQKRIRHCCKCGSNECKGKGGRAFCNNPCQDCGKLECKGRNSKRPDRTCADAWP